VGSSLTSLEVTPTVKLNTTLQLGNELALKAMELLLRSAFIVVQTYFLLGLSLLDSKGWVLQAEKACSARFMVTRLFLCAKARVYF
jgi:hypothetical protein